MQQLAFVMPQAISRFLSFALSLSYIFLPFFLCFSFLQYVNYPVFVLIQPFTLHACAFVLINWEGPHSLFGDVVFGRKSMSSYCV